jgi:hypothetical protein
MSTRQKALKIHPICDMVPKMSAEAFEALKADIQKNGQVDPIWVKTGEIIDGRHRWRACRELGRQCKTQEFQGDDIETFVISVNVSRRHLSNNQKAWFIKRLLALHPEHSNRAIAAAVGVDDKTVRSVRASGAEFPHLKTTGLDVKHLGRDGKMYAASRTAVTTSAASLITKTDLDARRFIKWLDDLHPNELTDSALFIRQLQTQLDRLLSFAAAKTAI